MSSRSLRLPPDLVGFIALCAAICAIVFCANGNSFGSQATDPDPHGIVAAFDDLVCDPPGSAPAAPNEQLDVTVFEALAPAAAAPAEQLDVSVFEALQCDPDPPKPKPTPRGAADVQQKLLDSSGVLQMADVTTPKPVVYPERSQHWTHPGDSREELIRHLKSGMHAGKWSDAWLRQQTTAQLEALHSDDHEGKATLKLTTAIAQTQQSNTSPPQESRIVPLTAETWAAHMASTGRTPSGSPLPKPVAALAPSPKVQQAAPVVRQACPGGVCPTQYSQPVRYSSNGFLGGLFRPRRVRG